MEGKNVKMKCRWPDELEKRETKAIKKMEREETKKMIITKKIWWNDDTDDNDYYKDDNNDEKNKNKREKKQVKQEHEKAPTIMIQKEKKKKRGEKLSDVDELLEKKWQKESLKIFREAETQEYLPPKLNPRMKNQTQVTGVTIFFLMQEKVLYNF